jgi:LacI family transcriptional regulator
VRNLESILENIIIFYVNIEYNGGQIVSVTIKDIARMANVSHTTVSRALQDSPEISMKTKQRIREIAQSLNYTSNALARGLVLKRSYSLGLVIPDIINPYYAQISKAVEHVAYASDFSLIICNSDRNIDKENRCLRFLQEKKVDGIIMVTVSSQPEPFQDLARAGIPLVLIDNLVPGVNTDFVSSNNFYGAALIVKHLVEMGYKRIAHFAGPRNSFASQERLKAYLQVLKENNIPVDKDLIITTNATLDEGRKAAEQLLQLGMLPEAVFAVNDSVAIGALRHFWQQGIIIPKDLALVGYDDIDMAAMLPAPLTTVRQQPLEVGRIAAETLFERITGFGEIREFKKIILPPQLIIRKSCGEGEKS